MANHPFDPSVQSLRRFNEAIALDYVLPFRVRKPQEEPMPLDQQHLLACVENMNDEQLTRLAMALAKVDGLRQLREIYLREAEALVDSGKVMPQWGKDLVANVEELRKQALFSTPIGIKPEYGIGCLRENMEALLATVPPPAEPPLAKLLGRDVVVVQGDKALPRIVIKADRKVVVRSLYGGEVGLLAAEVVVEGVRSWRRVSDGYVFDSHVTLKVGDSPAGLFTPPEGCVAAGRAQATMTLRNIMVPPAVLQAFLTQYGDVTKAAINNLHVSRQDRRGALEVRNCVLSVHGHCVFIRGMAFVDCMTFMATDVYGEPTFRPEAKPLGAIGLDYKREQEALLEELAYDGLPSAAPLDDATREKIQRAITEKGALGPPLVAEGVMAAFDPDTLNDATKVAILRNGWDDLGKFAEILATRPSGAQAAPAIQTVWGEVPTRPGTMMGDVMGEPVGDPTAIERLAMVDPELEAIVPFRERWKRACARWARLFDSAIPMPVLALPAEAELEAVEAMLYDKETKGIDPARCACGCGFVAGCRSAEVKGVLALATSIMAAAPGEDTGFSEPTKAVIARWGEGAYHAAVDLTRIAVQRNNTVGTARYAQVAHELLAAGWHRKPKGQGGDAGPCLPEDEA